MNRFLYLVLALTFTAPAYGESFDSYLGYWKGTLLKNIKDKSAGGNAAQGDARTPVDMMFMRTESGIAGYGRVGKDNIEVWVLEGDQFNWTEGSILVKSKREKNVDSLPDWIAGEHQDAKKDSLRAYRIQSCVRVVDDKPCISGKDVPKGLVSSAVFTLHFDQKNQLRFGAFYAYDKEQTKRRILTWYGERKAGKH